MIYISYLWWRKDSVLGMFLKFLETNPLKNVCFASNRMVHMFLAGPNLTIQVQVPWKHANYPFCFQAGLESNLLELVDEYPSLGMFSSSSDVSMVELLDSCSGIDPSTPNYSGATKSPTASTPKNVKVSEKESSDPSTSSPSNNILPCLPLTQPSASALTPVSHNLCSKRKVLFSEEDCGENSPASKARLPDYLPFPDRFSIRVEEAIASNQAYLWENSSFLTLGRLTLHWVNTHFRGTTSEWLFAFATNSQT